MEKVNVEVSQTISKVVTVETDDYKEGDYIGLDDNNNPIFGKPDFSNTDFKNMITISNILENSIYYLKEAVGYVKNNRLKKSIQSYLKSLEEWQFKNNTYKVVE